MFCFLGAKGLFVLRFCFVAVAKCYSGCKTVSFERVSCFFKKNIATSGEWKSSHLQILFVLLGWIWISLRLPFRPTMKKQSDKFLSSDIDVWE